MTQIKVYIPSVFRHSKAVNDFIDRMLREFNGMTVYSAKGLWQDRDTIITTKKVLTDITNTVLGKTQCHLKTKIDSENIVRIICEATEKFILKNLETETVKVYEMVSNNEDIEEIYAIVSHEALKLKKLLNQQTILFTINNKPYFL